MNKNLGLVLILAALQACSHHIVPFDRTEYVVTQKGNLMVTNSDVYNDLAYPKKEGEKFEIKYPFFLENSSATETSNLQFNQAYFKILSEKTTVKCQNRNKDEPFTEVQLKPNQRLAVNCTIQIPVEVAKKIKGDQKGFFEIPFTDKKQKNTLSFLYIVKQEDFE